MNELILKTKSGAECLSQINTDMDEELLKVNKELEDAKAETQQFLEKIDNIEKENGDINEKLVETSRQLEETEESVDKLKQIIDDLNQQITLQNETTEKQIDGLKLEQLN
eukprot:Platyproteum_vivax@DN7505_c0_g2_i1.p1